LSDKLPNSSDEEDLPEDDSDDENSENSPGGPPGSTAENGDSSSSSSSSDSADGSDRERDTENTLRGGPPIGPGEDQLRSRSARYVPEPPPDESQKPTSKEGDELHGIMDDSPLLGRQILCATKRIAAGSPVETLAVCFREYNSKANTETNIIRLVFSRMPAEADMLRSTICMRKLSFSRKMKAKKNVLFLPVTHGKTGALKALEAFLLERCIPLTAIDLCLDWFICRFGLVTATSGDVFARHDEAAHALIREGPFSVRHLSAKDAAELLRKQWVFPRGISTPEMRSGSINEDKVFEAIKREVWVKDAFKCGLFVSKSTRSMGATPDGIAVLLLDRETGDFSSAEQLTDTIEIIVAVEIKTRFSREKIVRALRCAHEFGEGKIFFKCKVGDDCWWKAVPEENRAQVIQQAAVLGVNHVLFCVASDVNMIMMVLVEVSDEQKQIYENSIKQWSMLTDWLHDSLTDAGAPPKPPSHFSEEDKMIIASHVRIWRAMRKKILEEGGPLWPVYLVKCAAQVIYNKLKGGLDGNTQNVRALTSMAQAAVPTSIEQKLVTRGIKQAINNAACLYRIRAVYRKGGRWATIKQFRQRCNKATTIVSYGKNLALELVNHAEVLATRPAPAVDAAGRASTVIPFSGEEILELQRAVKRHRRGIIEQFNSGQHKILRLTGGMIHKPEPIGSRIIKAGKHQGKVKMQQQNCLECGGDAANICVICTLPLHYRRKRGQHGGVTCFYSFHSKDHLD